MRAFFALVLLALPVHSLKAAENPVTKVVELITELKAKIEEDGKSEQKLYDKYACWCEKTTLKYSTKIAEEKVQIEELSQKIVKLKATLGALSADIAQLTKEVAETKAAIKEATAIREKENADFVGAKTEMEQAIAALEKAINVLAAGTGLTLAQTETQLLSVAADVKVAMRYASTVQIPQSKIDTVRSFLSSSMSNYNVPYAPASTQIQGILKDMYDTFTANLETANSEEGTAEKNYQELMAAKNTELKTLEATLEKKTEANAVATKDEADSQQERADTEEELADDEKFFEDTKEGCKAKADDWANRSRLRTEELNGIHQALEILTGPEAQEIFARATSFIQVSARGADLASKAAAELRSTKSVRLLTLLQGLSTAGGHFDVVINAIDKMIVLCREEEQEDVRHKNWCENENAELKNTMEDLEYDHGELNTLKSRQQQKKQETEANLAVTNGDIMDLKQLMADNLDQRNGEHDEFVSALKDDQAAVELLGKTIEVLGAFYKKNNIPTLLQKDSPPEYTIDEDKAPDATFSDKGAHKTESGGILGILAMIKEDLSNEIKNGKADESRAQEEYKKDLADNNASMANLEKKKSDLETMVSDTKKAIAATNENMSANKNQQSATKTSQNNIEPNCNWVADNFEPRREKRKTEIDGLQNAKDILAGATGDSYGGSLVQKKSRVLPGAFDDSALDAVSFLQRRN